MNAITEEKIGDYTVKVLYDENPCNPREDYEHYTTIYSNCRDYNPDNHSIGEIIGENDRLDKDFLDKHYIKKIYAYIHSGISLSLQPSSDTWDSGLFGIIALPKEGWGEDEVDNIVDTDIEELNAYYNGEVYSYAVFDKNGDQIDGCNGYYDQKDALEDGKSYAEGEIKRKEQELEEMRVAVRDAVDELRGRMFCDGQVLVTVSKTPQKYEFFAQNIKDGEVQQPAHAVGVEYLHREILEPMVKSLANN